jgi:hypothetical protein
MRRAVAVVLASLPLVVAACGRREGTSETITWSGPLAPGVEFALRNRNGSVTVEEGTADSATLVLTVRRRSRGTESPRLQVLQSGRGVIACVLYPGMTDCTADGYGNGADARGEDESQGIEVSSVLRLPAGHRLDLRTGNGAVRVNVASTGARVETDNGSLRIHKVTGPLDAITTNGSVRLYDCVGAITVGTDNGSVRLYADTIGGDVNVKTSNGSITAWLRPGVDAALALSSSNGSTTLDLPGNVTAKTRSSLDAILGRGTHKVVLVSSNAAITVKPREAKDGDD